MIDLIIPVYNSSKTIARTLNSILNQLICDELTVYLIDDCSHENYSDLIKYFSQYMKIKYFKLEKNSGPGVARQYGLEHSDGEFIVFMDSDDEFYKDDALLMMKSSITGYNMVFAKMIDINQNSAVSFHEGCLHGKMYRRCFLESKKIKFNRYRSHEDNAFNQLCLATAQGIKYLDEIVYTYHHTETSITNTEDSKKSLKTYIKSMTWLFKEIDKQQELDYYYVGVAIYGIILYAYHNYLLDKNEYSFVLKDMSALKKSYYKYKDCINNDDRLRIFKNFNYPVIPDITIEEFIEMIEE